MLALALALLCNVSVFRVVGGSVPTPELVVDTSAGTLTSSAIPVAPEGSTVKNALNPGDGVTGTIMGATTVDGQVYTSPALTTVALNFDGLECAPATLTRPLLFSRCAAPDSNFAAFRAAPTG